MLVSLYRRSIARTDPLQISELRVLRSVTGNPMAISAKILFLAVHTSNALIRSLFLPLCYLFLLSPFALLTIRYAIKNEKISTNFLASYDIKSLGLQVTFAVTWACIATRFLSNRGVDGKGVGKRTVPNLPYWIPGLRHWGNVVFGGERWLKGIR